MRAEWFALLWREDVKLASDADESAISLGCVENDHSFSYDAPEQPVAFL
jgi:hypothetical protein